MGNLSPSSWGAAGWELRAGIFAAGSRATLGYAGLPEVWRVVRVPLCYWAFPGERALLTSSGVQRSSPPLGNRGGTVGPVLLCESFEVCVSKASYSSSLSLCCV